MKTANSLLNLVLTVIENISNKKLRARKFGMQFSLKVEILLYCWASHRCDMLRCVLETDMLIKDYANPH